jgi:hypothetical protein
MKIRLFSCNTEIAKVPQGNGKGEMSNQLVRGGILFIRKSQG